MGALAAAVHPFAGGVPRRAAPAPSPSSCDANERASGKKPRRVVAPARDSSACLAGVEELYVSSQKRKMMTCNRNNVVETAAADTKVLTAGVEMSPRELLPKRLASELDVLRGLLEQAKLISRRGACKGGAGAPTAGKKERFLASKQRAEPTEDGGGNAPSVKRKISTLVEQKQKQKQVRAPRMSAEERSQLTGRLSSLSAELPEHIWEFLLKQFGDADAHGEEIDIDIDSVEDSVLFELKTQLDKFAEERPVVVDAVLPEEKDEKQLAEQSKSKGILEQEVKTGSRPSSRSSSSDPDTDGDDSAGERCSDEFPALREARSGQKQVIATSAQPPSEPAQAVRQSTEAEKKAQDVQRAAPKAVYMPGLIYRANLRRQLLEMERAEPALPDQSIHPRDLHRFGIAEYGQPGLMRQLGLFLKADDA